MKLAPTVLAAAATAVVVAPALLVQGASAAADPSGSAQDKQTTLRFDVQFSPFSYTDLGQPGPSAADMIVFNDVLLRDGHQVGHETGSCVVVDPTGLSNCTAVLTVDGRGTITYALENSPPPRKTLAVTGGSGAFRTAAGDGVLLEHGDGTGSLTLTIDLD
jgi:hypothetical protein